MADDATVSDAELDAVVASIEASEQPSDGPQPPPLLGPDAADDTSTPDGQAPVLQPEPAEPRPGQLPPLDSSPPLDNPFMKKKVYALPPPPPEPQPEPEQDPGVRDGGKAYHTDGIRQGGTTAVLWEVSLDVVAMGVS